MTIPGSITSGGVFTAATTAGTYTDAIEATVGAVSGLASVSVLASSGLAAYWRANEPAGYSTITDKVWDNFPTKNGTNPDADGWTDQTGSASSGPPYADSNFAIATDATAPISPSNVGQGIFRTTQPGGASPFSLQYNYPTPVSKVYICLTVKLSSNWTNTTNSMTKFTWFDPGGVRLGHVYSAFVQPGADPYFNLMTEGTPGGSGQQYLGGNLNSAASRITPGNWYVVEMLLTMNTSGNADGTYDQWINGVHTGSYTNLHYYDGSNPYWYDTRWEPTYGGGLTSPPVEMNMYMDSYYVSGS